MSKAHGMEMFKENDAPHLEAMNKMCALMTSPDSKAMMEWFENKRKEFEALPDNPAYSCLRPFYINLNRGMV
ncbi:MAG: hypothetical protein ACI9JN_000520 [Bacteroidia bacterium]|jgi:hypothetical protein